MNNRVILILKYWYFALNSVNLRRIFVAMIAFNIPKPSPSREKHSEDNVLISVTENWATGHLALPQQTHHPVDGAGRQSRSAQSNRMTNTSS